MERSIGMQLLVTPIWITVAFKETILDPIYHRAAKRMLGIKSYRQLPRWTYKFLPGKRGDFRFLYFVVNHGIAGQERVMQRRVVVYGYTEEEAATGKADQTMAEIRRVFKLHSLERVGRCKHGRLVKAYSPHGGCRNCRMSLVREYKTTQTTDIRPLTPSDPDYEFFATNMLAINDLA